MNKTRSQLIRKITATLTVLTVLGFSAARTLAAGTNLVIVEAYGGGGNSGSTYKNDFIGLFNRGTTPVDVTGWSVQYASATGTSWQTTPLTATTIPVGGYYLVQEGPGAGGTVNLPTPDATGTIAMGATAFKVALVSNVTPLSGQFATGTGPTIVDFVGAGTNVNGFEGTAQAPPPSNTLSVQRNNNGCLDTDVNTNDFFAAAPNPRNSGTPTHSCAILVPPLISGINPPGLTTNAGNDVTFTVSLSQGDAPVYYQWYTQSTDGNTSTLIPNATNSALTLPSVLAANGTNYVVVVTNNAASANSVTSAPVTLTVIDPAINIQPASQIVLPNGTAQFRAAGAGTGISYQWYFANAIPVTTGPVTDGPLTSGAFASGSTSNILTITNVTAATQTNFVLVVTGTFGSITSSLAGLVVSSTSVPLGFWNFNDTFDPTNPAPYQGIGTAMGLNDVTFVQPTRDGNDPTSGNNLAWGTQTYPASTVSNKQAGVQFNVSTLGAKNIKLSFDLRGTPTASKYLRLQYTTNGTDFVDYPASLIIASVQASTYNSYNYDLTGFPGVANNPNFGVRIVTEFESTALYNNTNDATYVAISGSYSSAGTLSFDLVDITGDAIVGNNKPPTIGTIPATVTVGDTVGTNITFTVSDDSTPAGSLVANAATIDNPNTSVSFSAVNTAGSVKLTISPSLGLANPLNVPVLVTVTDGNGDLTTASFLLTIIPANAPPVFTGLINTNMLTNTSLTIPFTLIDDHTPATSLTPTATSGNSSLVPNDASHLSIGGSGTNRTLIITPAADQYGTVPITLTANDGVNTAIATTVVVVRPNTNVFLADRFDYDTAGNLTAVSLNFWQAHSSAGSGPVQVGSGTVTVSGSKAEDVNAPLIGAPYTTNSPAVLYATFKVNFSALPAANSTYFAHFKDNTTFGFFGRILATTSNAAPGTYRLVVGNSSGVTNSTAEFPLDLNLNTSYTVVVKTVVSNAFSTLWVNPANEGDTHVTDTTLVTNTASVYAYAFRQSTGEGTLTIDDLKVGSSFSAVTGLASVAPAPPAPTISSISVGGPGNTNIIITGTNNNGANAGSYVVLISTNIGLPLSNWTVLSTQTFNPDGTLNFTNGMGTDPNRFYILQALP